MTQFVERRMIVEPEWTGRRLDQALAAVWDDFSRSRITAWIRDGRLQVDGRTVKPNFRLSGGESVVLEAELEPHGDPQPESMDLEILWEGEHALVVNKPAELVVHPGSGNPDGTLVNGLLAHDPDLAPLPRAGLVHRLDKDTTGCLLIARTLKGHSFLVQAMKRREIAREYQALVRGKVISGGRVDAPMGRHPVDRRRQVVSGSGKPAITHYRVARSLVGSTLLDVRLETGRTHQIRVHMAHLGFPIIGDRTYGRSGAPAGLTVDQRETWNRFPRQALHAARLSFPLPDCDEPVTVSAPLPPDMEQLIRVLSDE